MYPCACVYCTHTHTRTKAFFFQRASTQCGLLSFCAYFDLFSSTSVPFGVLQIFQNGFIIFSSGGINRNYYVSFGLGFVPNVWLRCALNNTLTLEAQNEIDWHMSFCVCIRYVLY